MPRIIDELDTERLIANVDPDRILEHKDCDMNIPTGTYNPYDYDSGSPISRSSLSFSEPLSPSTPCLQPESRVGGRWSRNSCRSKPRRPGFEDIESQSNGDVSRVRLRWRFKNGRGCGERGRQFRICIASMFAILMILSVGNLLYLFIGFFSAWAWAGDIQTFLAAYEKGDNVWYPTSFTRDIVPKKLHSHNDYWRKAPLFDAIFVGAISVEGDVWKFDGDDNLYVGHDLSSLTRNRTLSSMYIDPILSILKRQNPNHEFAKNTLNGIFDTSPGQSVNLYIDIKTTSEPTYNAILKHLEPLITPVNYLTHYLPNTNTLVRGPITVIITGNAPFNLIAAPPANSTLGRYTFYDAPVQEIAKPNPPGQSWSMYNNTNVLMATSHFGTAVGPISITQGMDDRQRQIIREQLKAAHEKGIGVRYWDTPNWPVRGRNIIWRQLIDEGVDLLNVDDLKAAAYMEW